MRLTIPPKTTGSATKLLINREDLFSPVPSEHSSALRNHQPESIDCKDLMGVNANPGQASRLKGKSRQRTDVSKECG